MVERRREPRLRVLKAGKVRLNACVTVDCTIRDISRRGARLEFEGPVSLPAEFQLRFVGAELTVRASPAWQRRLEAGVLFARGAPQDLRKRIAPAL